MSALQDKSDITKLQLVIVLTTVLVTLTIELVDIRQGVPYITELVHQLKPYHLSQLL